LLSRKDPVIYRGDTAYEGPLSDEELISYERNGFLHLEGFYNRRETAVLREELESLRTSEQVRQSEISMREPQTGETRSVFAAETVSELFSGLACDQRILAVVQQLLGSKVYLHQTRVNFKPGFRGREFYWHADFETWHAEDGMRSMRAVTCVIYVTEGSSVNGPLMLIPGSHTAFCQCAGLTPEEHYKSLLNRKEYAAPEDDHIQELVEKNGIKVIEGSVGSVVFFDCNLLHGSNSNITPYNRTNIFLSYNSVENALGDPFSTETERPWYLANREPTPLEPCDFQADVKEAGA
jgi:ectoine hydroxylase